MSERRSLRWPLLILPAVWLVLGVVGGAGIVWLVRADAPTEAQVAPPGPAAEPTEPPASPEPAEQPEPEPTPDPVASRSITVSVYNQIGVGGLAARVAGQARAAGWTVGQVADWRGGVPQDTVYFPPDQRHEAELLGRDLAIARLMPAVDSMSDRQLTVVLASPR